MPSVTIDPLAESEQQDLLVDAAGGLDTSSELEASQHPGGTAYDLAGGATSVTPAPAFTARPRYITFTPTAAEIGQQQQQQQGVTPIATATTTATSTAAAAVGQRPTAAGLQATARRTYLGVTQEVEHALLQWQSFLGKNDAAAQESFRDELGRSTDLQILVAAPVGSTVLTVIHSVACFFSIERHWILSFVMQLWALWGIDPSSLSQQPSDWNLATLSGRHVRLW